MKVWNAVGLTTNEASFSKEHKAAAKRASVIINQWRPKIDWLREWDGEVQPVPQEYGGHFEAAMCIEMEDLWHKARVSIRPSAVGLEDEEFELCVLHELSHIFVNEFMGEGRMQYDDPNHLVTVERACWRLAKTLYNTK